MKRSSEYILRHAADSIVIVPVGRAAVEFPGMLTVNATGELLWDLLESERRVDELVDALCDRFEVERCRALADTEAFLQKLRRAGALIENDP